MDTAVANFVQKLKFYGVGRRNLDDELFKDVNAPTKYGIYDLGDENQCHEESNTKCCIPGCTFISTTLLEFEEHYNSLHRYSCSQCKKTLPSAHLLDLHLQESHDSFFAVMSEKKPSYCCYIEECKDKFMTTDERHNHCVKVHKLPKDFRFEQKVNKNRKKVNKTNTNSMETDSEDITKVKKKVVLSNNKQKTFPKYTGRKFTNNDTNTKNVMDLDITVNELKETLPQ